MYERARKGELEDDVEIESRTVHIDELRLCNTEKFPPKLDINVTVGGGTYIRSLVRDIAHAVDTVATTTSLRRTKQGFFVEDDCLAKEDWNADNFFAAIDRFNAKVGQLDSSTTETEPDT
jgi:tRNA pseudouridine55 synthase